MSEAVMIIAPSGSGKSYSLRNLDPESSFLIQTLRKSLPFKGWKEKWPEVNPEKPGGKRLVSDDPQTIIKYLKTISDKKPEIKVIAIDDSQYVMANEFMRSALEKGYEKFTRIGLNFWEIVQVAGNLRDDLAIVFLHHEETTEFGNMKAKTIGKMLDDKITLEGMFTIVLRATVHDGKHVFITQNSGRDTVKAPPGMFETAEIDNDINLVLNAITAY